MPIGIAEKIKVKWPRNAERGADNYEYFIKLVDVNPMELAAANAEKWKARLMEIMDVWPEIMKKIPFDYWKNIVEQVGKDHYIDGVRTKKFKVEAFADAWEKVYGPELNKIRALPAKTDADREKRMIENRKVLKKLKGKWR